MKLLATLLFLFIIAVFVTMGINEFAGGDLEKQLAAWSVIVFAFIAIKVSND